MIAVLISCSAHACLQRVVYRNPVNFFALLTGSDTGDHRSAILQHVLRNHRSFAARDALNDNFRIAIDQYSQSDPPSHAVAACDTWLPG